VPRTAEDPAVASQNMLISAKFSSQRNAQKQIINY